MRDDLNVAFAGFGFNCTFRLGCLKVNRCIILSFQPNKPVSTHSLKSSQLIVKTIQFLHIGDHIATAGQFFHILFICVQALSAYD